MAVSGLRKSFPLENNDTQLFNVIATAPLRLFKQAVERDRPRCVACIAATHWRGFAGEAVELSPASISFQSNPFTKLFPITQLASRNAKHNRTCVSLSRLC